MLKTLQFGGELSGSEIAARLGLGFSVIEPAVELLKAERQCEIRFGSADDRPRIPYQYRITDAGRLQAALFLEHNRYVGVAPVPVEQYRRYMSAFQQAAPCVKRQRVREAFTHLVVSTRVLDQIGPAVNASHSIFVYGPPGNGKTVISQAIARLLTGEIAIPHAIEVGGNIIRFFDPVNHEPIPLEKAPRALDAGLQRDARWVLCRRPTVLVGGELTLEALDLTLGEVASFYRAPVQAIANGGVLLIDDFGRQRCSPRDLLNRWIVPLESRVDHLTLKSGLTFELPFTALIIFATNLKPSELVDEAFTPPDSIPRSSPTARRFRTSSGSSRTTAARCRSRSTVRWSSVWWRGTWRLERSSSGDASLAI